MNDNTKKCPMCAEMIPVEAATCEYCGAEFQVTITGYCTNCHEVREADEKGHCKQCGSEVADKHIESKFVEEAAAQTVQPLPTTAAAPRANQNKAWIWALAGTLILAVIIGVGLRVLNGDISIPGFPRTVTIKIPADKLWVDTGITVKSGQTLTIKASGSLNMGGGDPTWFVPSPNGKYNSWCTGGCAYKRMPNGVLVGKIDSGNPFLVGSFCNRTATTGSLYLAVNDNISYYNDNEGSFTATITVR